MIRQSGIFTLITVCLITAGTGLSQANDIRGAWLSRGRWVAAPKEVADDLRATGAQILYFENDGTFTLWSGTLYSSNHHPPTISAGDSETLYSGKWSHTREGIIVTMYKAYADVIREGEKMPGPKERVSVHLMASRILFRGFWFHRDLRLGGQMAAYSDHGKKAFVR